MKPAADLLIALEMYLREKWPGPRAFGTTRGFAPSTKVLAANQGLYNGFLAAGLFWGLSLESGGDSVKTFLLSGVLVAGKFGAATARGEILFVQAIPAAVIPVLPCLG